MAQLTSWHHLNHMAQLVILTPGVNHMAQLTSWHHLNHMAQLASWHHLNHMAQLTSWLPPQSHGSASILTPPQSHGPANILTPPQSHGSASSILTPPPSLVVVLLRAPPSSFQLFHSCSPHASCFFPRMRNWGYTSDGEWRLCYLFLLQFSHINGLKLICRAHQLVQEGLYNQVELRLNDFNYYGFNLWHVRQISK